MVDKNIINGKILHEHPQWAKKRMSKRQKLSVKWRISKHEKKTSVCLHSLILRITFALWVHLSSSHDMCFSFKLQDKKRLIFTIFNFWLAFDAKRINKWRHIVICDLLGLDVDRSLHENKFHYLSCISRDMSTS